MMGINCYIYMTRWYIATVAVSGIRTGSPRAKCRSCSSVKLSAGVIEPDEILDSPDTGNLARHARGKSNLEWGSHQSMQINDAVQRLNIEHVGRLQLRISPEPRFDVGRYPRVGVLGWREDGTARQRASEQHGARGATDPKGPQGRHRLSSAFWI